MGLFSKLFGGDEAKVAVTGREAQATIVSLREGGPYVNDRPTITIELDVELPGSPPYRATAKQVVGRLVIGRLAPGVTVPVRVDPNDSAAVAIDEPAMLGQ